MPGRSPDSDEESPPSVPSPLTELPEEELERVLRGAVARVEPEELRAAVSGYPANVQRVIFHMLGLRRQKAMTPSVAANLTSMLRGPGAKTRSLLIELLTSPTIYCLSPGEGPSPEECARLLQTDTAEAFLRENGRIATGLYFAVALPLSLGTLALAGAARYGTPLAPAALGLLAGTPDALDDTTAETARGLWGKLRATAPVLPENPIGLQALRDVLVNLHTCECCPKERTPVPEDATAPVTLPITDTRQLMDRLHQGFANAAHAADRARQALVEGARPQDDDIRAIADAVQDFDRLAAHLVAEAAGAGVGAEDEPATLLDLEQVANEIATARDRAARVAALVHLTGPQVLETEIMEIREEASKGTSNGLEALAALIELSADEQGALYSGEADDLENRARQEMPPRWHKVIRAATRGHLRLEPLPQGDPPVQGSHDEPSAGNEPEANREDETARETKNGQDTETEQEPEDHTGEDGPARHTYPDEEGPAGEDDGGGGPPSTLGPQTPPPPAADTDHEGDPAPYIPALDAELAARFAPPARKPAAKPDGNGATPADASAPTVEAADGTKPTSEANPPTPESHASGWQYGEAETEALRTHRLGLAAWLRRAAGRPDGEFAARRCAALADRTTRFTGRLSAAFVDIARRIRPDDLSDDPGGRLLAWSAAIRAGLIQPTVEAARLLDELTPQSSSYPALHECGTVFGRALKSGVYLIPTYSNQIRGVVEAEDDHDRAVTVCARLLDELPRRKIKFARATDVWKSLIRPEGRIGRLLGVAANDDVARLHEVVQELDELRGGAVVDRLIDAEYRSVSGASNKKIIAGPRVKLAELIDEAVTHVATWAAAVREVQARDPDGSGEWLTRGLAELRQTLAANRPVLSAEMTALTGGRDPGAVEAALKLLDATARLLDGEPLGEHEPDAPVVLNQDLLLAPEVPVDAETLEALERPAPQVLVEIAAMTDADWRAAFDGRAARDDHEGTDAIIKVITDTDPDLAAELRQERDRLVTAASHGRDQRVEHVRDRLAEWRRDGVLPETDATRFEVRLQALAHPDRSDFGRIRRELDDVETEAARIRAAQIAAEEERLSRKAAANPDVRQAEAAIRKYLASGDLTTARECLAQAEAGKQPPAYTEKIDHLRCFFPAFPRAFADAAASMAGRRGRRQEGDGWITVLLEAIREDAEVADPMLRDTLRQAGIDHHALQRSCRENSAKGLRQWRAMSEDPRSREILRSRIEAVLRIIGLEGRPETITAAENRMWTKLSDVPPRDAPLPEFGSRMSPSGDSLRLLLVWKQPGPQQLTDWLRDEPEDRSVLVFYFGVLSPAQREQLAATARRRPRPPALVVDDAAISYLACLPEASWAATVSLLAPFSAPNPYAPTGDVPVEMFYGRTAQLEQVTGRSGSSIVYGGRQLGKSALLRKAERDIRKNDPGRVVIMDTIQEIGKVSLEHTLWTRLATLLAKEGVLPVSDASLKDRTRICQAVKHWIDEDPDRQLLILLDEADAFLTQDAANANFVNVQALRDLMQVTENRVKVVFAGLHQTERFHSLSNQPLPQLGTPIPVGPLDPQDAFDLLTRPLGALGFRFPPTLAARVIAEANNAPALIQLFADALLKRLRRVPVQSQGLPYEITREDVAAVWRDKTLAAGFRDRFEWTLNLDKRYKVIAYTVAFNALTNGVDTTLTVAELRGQCLYWWPTGFEKCTTDGFRGLLEECVNLGVLASDEDRYRLRTPHVLTLLGGEDEIGAVLENAEEFDLPDSFDAHFYRAAYKGGPDRSPLTAGQAGWLLGPRNIVHLITGSPALHIERVEAALEEEAARQGMAHVLRATKYTFDGAIRRARDSGDHGIVVVNLRDRGRRQALAKLKEAVEAVAARHAGSVAVVMIAPPELASLWTAVSTGSAEVGRAVSPLELRRYEALDVRQWMNDPDLDFLDEAWQAELLACTGGWPFLISKVLENSKPVREQSFDACRDWLEANADAFVQATGVRADPALSTAWDLLIDLGPERPEDLADYLAMAAEDGHDPLRADSLRHLGYATSTDVIEVLRMLGALVPRSNGALAPEPVLTKATRDARKQKGTT
ncbi:hypothetical protein AB0K60_35640 [Thermopolyspora sp. NPDC052614]|uniref:hypothetical protein n=1 Tax=Thermopolyspora sp. NPDC052614 TaxID=3155682 RepID=UPI003443A824